MRCKNVISKVEIENETQVKRSAKIYNSTNLAALFTELPNNYSEKSYPFSRIDLDRIGFRSSKTRNYLHGKSQTYKLEGFGFDLRHKKLREILYFSWGFPLLCQR